MGRWAVEQADGRNQSRRGHSRPNQRHAILKRWKVRIERRAAKHNPECQPLYGRYEGYET